MFRLGVAPAVMILLMLPMAAHATEDKAGLPGVDYFKTTFDLLQKKYIAPLDGCSLLLKALHGFQMDPAMSNPTDQKILQTAIRHLKASPSGDAVRSLMAPLNEAIEQLHAGPGHPPRERLFENASAFMTQGLDPQTGNVWSDGHGRPLIEPRPVGVGLNVVMEQPEIGSEGKPGTIRIVRAYPGYPAALAGIRSMDILLSVDGQPISGFSLDQVVSLLQDQAGSQTILVVERAGQRMTIRVTNKPLQPMEMVSRLLVGHVAYLQMNSFRPGTAFELRRHYEDERREAAVPLSGVILDLRLNSARLLDGTDKFDFHLPQESTVDEVVNTASEFLPQSAPVATLKARDAEDDRRLTAQGGDMTSGLPMIILVDGYTGGGSEMLAGALKDNERAIIVGSHTPGFGTIQTLFPGTNPWITILTTATIVLPSGHLLQLPGIVPDIQIIHYVNGSAGAIEESSVARSLIPKNIAHMPVADEVFYDLDHPERDLHVLEAVSILSLLHPPH